MLINPLKPSSKVEHDKLLAIKLSCTSTSKKSNRNYQKLTPPTSVAEIEEDMPLSFILAAWINMKWKVGWEKQLDLKAYEKCTTIK